MIPRHLGLQQGHFRNKSLNLRDFQVYALPKIGHLSSDSVTSRGNLHM